MISMKSKFKALFPNIVVEFIFVAFLVFISTLGHPQFLRTLEEDLALAFALVIYLQITIILFSFDYTKKLGVFQQVTYTMELILMLVFNNAYIKAIALDELSKRLKNKGEENG